MTICHRLKLEAADGKKYITDTERSSPEIVSSNTKKPTDANDSKDKSKKRTNDG